MQVKRKIIEDAIKDGISLSGPPSDEEIMYAKITNKSFLIEDMDQISKFKLIEIDKLNRHQILYRSYNRIEIRLLPTIKNINIILHNHGGFLLICNNISTVMLRYEIIEKYYPELYNKITELISIRL